MSVLKGKKLLLSSSRPIKVRRYKGSCKSGKWKTRVLILKRYVIRVILKVNRRIDSLNNRYELLRLEITQINNRLDQISGTISTLQANVNLLVAPIRALIVLLQSRIGTTITIDTDGGTVTGEVVTVGSDYVVIIEPTNAIVFIPLSSVNFII